MDKLKITRYKESFDAIANYIENEQKDQVEIWFARELQTVLGYARWENFVVAINRAIESCKTMNINVDDHFRDLTKMVALGSGSQREISDFMLTRFACYLIAQNGDPKKKSTRPLADFLPTLTIAAKNLATEMTNYNVTANDLQGEGSITVEHVQNNKTVREMLGKRGIKPEELPPAEDIKKMERRVACDEKKIEQSTKKLPKMDASDE